MLPQIDIENLLLLESSDAGTVDAAVASLTEALTGECDNLKAEGTRLRFHTQWEPPFKALKDWTKAHPECTLTLWADAFAKHHWLLKATVANGKSDELTVSRIDDEFDGIFREVYGCSFDDWEKKPSAPFSAGA